MPKLRNHHPVTRSVYRILFNLARAIATKEEPRTERLKSMEDTITHIRTRLNWLLTFIVGAAIANVVIALLE